MGKILIVEDQRMTQEGLVKIAKEFDETLEVISTGYAAKALSYAKKNSIDAFFLDIQLKDYSGIELARRLREVEEYMFTPIVFLTAIPTRELEAFRQIHCYDYIIKPFTQEEIRSVFEKIIKNYITKKDTELTLRLERKGFVNIVKQKDIICLEFKDRKICITTLKEKIYYSGKSLSQIGLDLSEDFIQVHQSFIVNKKYIEYINLTECKISLKGIEFPIPIGRTHKKTVGEISI